MVTEKELRKIIAEEVRREIAAAKQQDKEEYETYLAAQEEAKSQTIQPTNPKQNSSSAYKCGGCGCIVTKGLTTCPNCHELLEWD